MKTKLLTSLTLITVVANAATVSINNYSAPFGTNDYVIVANNGSAPLAHNTGVAVAGYFSLADTAVATLATTFMTAPTQENWSSILASFTGLTTPKTIGVTLSGTNLAGFYSQSNSATNPSAFAGQALYTLVGNASTLATSTEVAMFIHNDAADLIKATDTATTPASYSLTFGTEQAANSGTNRQLIRGVAGAATYSFAVGANNFTVNTSPLRTVVPETSTSLLGALGALALLRRRRN